MDTVLVGETIHTTDTQPAPADADVPRHANLAFWLVQNLQRPNHIDDGTNHPSIVLQIPFTRLLVSVDRSIPAL